MIDFERIFNLIREMPLIILFISLFSIFLFGAGLYFGSRLNQPINNDDENFENNEIDKIDKCRSE